MNLKIVYFILITFFFSNIVSSEEIDCNKFEKMSAKYIQCNAVKFKSKTDKKANQLKVKTNQKANQMSIGSFRAISSRVLMKFQLEDEGHVTLELEGNFY